MRSNEELKQIAIDLYKGLIFSDRQTITMSEMLQVFPILQMMGPADAGKFRARKPRFIFEYIDKAMPHGIDGKPMFLSFEYLTEAETAIMIEYYNAITKSIDNIEVDKEVNKNDVDDKTRHIEIEVDR